MIGNMSYSFPDETQSFVNGFEAGLVEAELLKEPEVLDTSDGFPKRIENIELYKLMGKDLGYDVGFHPVKYIGASQEEIEELNKEWVNVLFLEKRSGL